MTRSWSPCSPTTRSPCPKAPASLFSYQLPAEPATRRTGLIVAVRKLHPVLPALMKAGARLEHVYDY